MLSETLITRANSTYDSWEAGSLDDQVALQTLDQAFSKIDKESRLRFKETFDKINSGLQ